MSMAVAVALVRPSGPAFGRVRERGGPGISGAAKVSALRRA